MTDSPHPHRPHVDLGWHPEPELVDYSTSASREAVAEAGHRAVRSLVSYLFDVAPQHVVAHETYNAARSRYFLDGSPGPAPTAPSRFSDVLNEWDERQAPYQFNFTHPGALAYFTGPPLLASVFAELLIQITNQSVDVWRTGPTAALVEEEVISWLLQVTGLSSTGFGILTSGGVMANLVGMAMARDYGGLPEAGVIRRGAPLEKCTVYASDQTHFSVRRSLDVLGFPSASLRVVPTDASLRLRGPALRSAIIRDRERGLEPIAVVATVGTTNCGAIDVVPEIADVAHEESLWLHVDAAYGGAACFSEHARTRVEGIERADSLTIDPHKWLFQAHDIGALLTPHRELLRSVFDDRPEYYVTADQEEPLHWYQWGVEGTRRARGLKLWLSWKHLGTHGLGKLVDHTIKLAGHIAEELVKAGDFEVYPAPPDLSVVTFRHMPQKPSVSTDRYQLALQRQLDASGQVWVSCTQLRGHTYLRAGVLNYFAGNDIADRLIQLIRSRSSAAQAEALGSPQP